MSDDTCFTRVKFIKVCNVKGATNECYPQCYHIHRLERENFSSVTYMTDSAERHIFRVS